MANNNTIYSSLYPIIDQHLSSKSLEFKRYILSYINRNTASLQINGPSKRLIFLESDKEIIYALTLVSKEQVKMAIKGCPLIQSSWQILNDPFNILITLMIINYLKNKDEKMAELTVDYLMLKFYSSIQYKYARYELNQNIMDYTINNLSNKYKIKQFKTIFETLIDSVKICFNTHRNRLIKGDDESIKNFIMAVNTRIQGIVKKIISAYEINRKNGNYMNTEEDSNDEENYRETTNNSMLITRLTNGLTISILTSPINDKLIRIACQECDTGFNEVKTCLQNIIRSKGQEVKEIFNLLLQLFLTDGSHKGSEINSKIFIIEMMKVYKKSNTKDETIIRIKELLDIWLQENSLTYMKTQRIATKNGFRRAIYMYYILFIYQYNG